MKASKTIFGYVFEVFQSICEQLVLPVLAQNYRFVLLHWWSRCLEDKLYSCLATKSHNDLNQPSQSLSPKDSVPRHTFSPKRYRPKWRNQKKWMWASFVPPPFNKNLRKSALSAKVMCCPDKLTHLAQFFLTWSLMISSPAEARSISGVPHCITSLPRLAHLVSCKIKDEKKNTDFKLVDFGQCIPKNIYRRDLSSNKIEKHISIVWNRGLSKSVNLSALLFFLLFFLLLHPPSSPPPPPPPPPPRPPKGQLKRKKGGEKKEKKELSKCWAEKSFTSFQLLLPQRNPFFKVTMLWHFLLSSLALLLLIEGTLSDPRRIRLEKRGRRNDKVLMPSSSSSKIPYNSTSSSGNRNKKGII